MRKIRWLFLRYPGRGEVAVSDRGKGDAGVVKRVNIPPSFDKMEEKCSCCKKEDN